VRQDVVRGSRCIAIHNQPATNPDRESFSCSDPSKDTCHPGLETRRRFSDAPHCYACVHTRFSMQVQSGQPCFTTDQMSSIIASAKGQMWAFFSTAAGTGMRSGELCGLRCEDVDLNSQIISVRRSSREGAEQSPKTGNAVRRIGIDADLVRILKEHLGWQKIRVRVPISEWPSVQGEQHPKKASASNSEKIGYSPNAGCTHSGMGGFHSWWKTTSRCP